MRWPFVSRAAFELMREQRDEYRNAWRALGEKIEQARAAAPVIPERKRDELAEVIALRAGSDPALKRHLHLWANAQRREKVDETAIMNSILHWQGSETDEGVPA